MAHSMRLDVSNSVALSLFGVICMLLMDNCHASEFKRDFRTATLAEKYSRIDPTITYGDGCETGNCTRTEYCQTQNLIARNATGLCGKKRGDWVCCDWNFGMTTSGSKIGITGKFISPKETSTHLQMDHHTTGSDQIIVPSLLKNIVHRQRKVQNSSTLAPRPHITSKEINDCVSGKCILRENCIRSSDAVAVQPAVGACSRRRPAGFWVCCTINSNDDIPTTTTESIVRTNMNAWRVTQPPAQAVSRTESDLSQQLNIRNTIISSRGPKIEVSEHIGGKNNRSSKFLYKPSYTEGYKNLEADSYDNVPVSRNPTTTRRTIYSVYDDDHPLDTAGCLKGNCVPRKACSVRDSNLLPATGSCGFKPGDWVCCHLKSTSVRTTASTTTWKSTARSLTRHLTSTTRKPGNGLSTSTYPSYSGNKWEKRSTSSTFTTAEAFSPNVGCSDGKCVDRTNCQSLDSIALPATGNCAKRTNGDFVCCHERKTSRRATPQTRTSTSSSTQLYTNTRTHLRNLPSDYTTKRSYIAKPSQSSFGECGFRQGLRDGKTAKYNRLRMDPDAEIITSNTDSPFLNSVVRNNKVVGGREAKPYTWPWMVALFREASPGIRTFLCAGSLISHRYIISAAHVFTARDIRNPASFIGTLGIHSGTKGMDEYRIKSISIHPEYQHRYYYNDIAILELEKRVSFNQYVLPICLPSNDQYCQDSELVGKNVTVTGWGDEAFGGKRSEVLKEATFPVVSRSRCNSSYVNVASSKFPRGISDSMLCAGAPGGGKDACQGDSGGPLVIKQGQNWVQIGVVSFGYSCGDPQYPGVYTKLAKYVDWIKQKSDHYR